MKKIMICFLLLLAPAALPFMWIGAIGWSVGKDLISEFRLVWNK